MIAFSWGIVFPDPHFEKKGLFIKKSKRKISQPIEVTDYDNSDTSLMINKKNKLTLADLKLKLPPVPDFEISILKRAEKASVEKLKAYQPDIPVGERIRILRKVSGLTLNAVATKAEITKGSLCSIEKNSRSIGLAVIKKIAKALNVPTSVLIE